MIGLLAALVLQSAGWEGVSADGWTYEGEGTTVLLFTRPFDGVRTDRIWVRYEYAASHPNARGYRSTRALVAANCEEGQLKSLQTTSFREPNLNGASYTNEIPEDWFYPAPDTLHSRVLSLVCRAAP